MLTHVVLFKLKDPSRAAEVRDRLLALKPLIPEIREIDAGVDIVGSDRSWHVALITKFDDLAAMERYQVHPAHVAFKEFLAPFRDTSVAVDY